MKKDSWNSHYTKEKSMLSFPDENLVRMLKRHLLTIETPEELKALDLGCGSGRHLSLLKYLNITSILGFDISYNALKLSKEQENCTLLQCDNKSLALKDSSLDLIISWGSLHYNIKEDLPHMLDEIKRVLKPGGTLLATLRTSRDTYMRRGKHLGNNVWATDLNDISGTTTSFYSEEELKENFKLFNDFTYGIIERSAMGDIEKIISHWIISAKI